MNSRSQQAVVDAITAVTILGVGAILVAAGRVLIDRSSPGSWGDPASVVASDRSSSLDVVLGLMACAAGLAVVAWWLLAMTLAIAAALLTAAGHGRSARWAGAVSPAFMRRLTLAVLGMSLVTGTAAQAAPDSLDPAWAPMTPATATSAASVPGAQTTQVPPPTPYSAPEAPPPSDNVPRAESPAPREPPAEAVASEDAPAPATGAAVTSSEYHPRSAEDPIEPAWTPTSPEPSNSPLLRTETRPVATGGTGAVEVRPGDSLWTIVGRQLGPGATELDVAEAWPRWFDANREVIGNDPDVIRPGQLLTPPTR
ncbi:hypothetical protein SPF06_00090 [Sinomonas sp. JGH33]|uniref:LysM domain-containing protein n=1 Tax=Sinomonas terricola TaxID=3110330 RepID=A0ABU5T0C7_9MICC|nr:hypothetical protein [Sinomonas sp. JGH33]MEA5453107.1 hypothetical protein [Sinomonas sp. JGH33]